MRPRFTNTLLLMVGLCLLACTKKTVDERKYESVRIASRTLIESVEANGSVDMTTRIEVYPPVAGILEQLLVREGDHVRKGQKLAVISSANRNALLDVAAAKGKDGKKYWEEQMLPTSVFSPTAGQVVTIYTPVGDRAGGAVLALATGRVIRADVEETDLPKVRVGQVAVVTFDVSDTARLTAKVTSIAAHSRTVNNVNVYPIEVAWPDKEAAALPFEAKFGMTVTLFLEVSKKEALSLPLNAVNGRSNRTISVLDENLKPLKLKLGNVYGEYVEVLSGGAEGRFVKVPSFSNKSDRTRGTPLLFKKR